MSARPDKKYQKVSRVRFTEDRLPAACRIDDFLPLIPIGRTTVWEWARRGLFPKPFKRGRLTLWHRDEILAWLELVP